MTIENIICGETAGERSVRDDRMNRSRLMEIATNNTGTVEDGNLVGQEAERESDPDLVKKNFL